MSTKAMENHVALYGNPYVIREVDTWCELIVQAAQNIVDVQMAEMHGETRLNRMAHVRRFQREVEVLFEQIEDQGEKTPSYVYCTLLNVLAGARAAFQELEYPKGPHSLMQATWATRLIRDVKEHMLLVDPLWVEEGHAKHARRMRLAAKLAKENQQRTVSTTERVNKNKLTEKRPRE